MKKPLLVTAMVALSVFKLAAQTEYLVKLDLQTGEIEKVKKLENVNWFLGDGTVFDTKRSCYVFSGNHDRAGSEWQLYTVNTFGEIVAKKNNAYVGQQSLTSGYAFNSENGKIYALLRDSIANEMYFGTFDPNIISFNKINSIERVNFIGIESATIDLNNKNYSVLGIDTGGISRLYSINLDNGEIIHNPLFPKNVSQQMRYDNGLNKLISFYRDSVTNVFLLVAIDPKTGSFETRMKLPMKPGIPLFRNGYDEVRHYYIFNGAAVNGSRLYTIDVANNKLLYDVPYPQFDSGDNLIYPRYDVATNTTYAMYWEAKTQSIDEIIPQLTFQATPNPFDDRVSIKLNKAVAKLDVAIYNVAGQQVHKEAASNTATLTILRNGLAAGLYTAHIIVNNQQTYAVKLVAK